MLLGPSLKCTLEGYERELVAIGSLSLTIVHPREVFKRAVVNSAHRIITVHNHPGDKPAPSREDIEVWDRLNKAGEILGILVLDHIIITPSGRFYSHTSERRHRYARRRLDYSR